MYLSTPLRPLTIIVPGQPEGWRRKLSGIVALLAARILMHDVPKLQALPPSALMKLTMPKLLALQTKLQALETRRRGES